MVRPKSPEGWLVRVTTPGIAGRPSIETDFYVRVSNSKDAQLLVKARPGDRIEVLREIPRAELDGLGVAPGEARQYD